MTRSVPLTQGALALVDDADYAALTQMGNWCLSNRGYAVHYTRIDGQRKVLFMHRVIMAAPPQLQVDHINRDRLDNRRANLRFATRSQNQANKGLQRNNSSRFKGVSWNKGRWEARIRYNGARLYLGRFDDPVLAARAYDALSRYLYADFAGLNFPDEAPARRLLETLLSRLNLN